MDNNIISAFIGLGSAIIVAIITGIFQVIIERKNRKIAEKQFEQSRNEYAAKIEQLYQEQRKQNIAQANEQFHAESNRFYQDLIRELQFYDALVNELHYLNKIVAPKSREFCSKGAYPYIDNNIKDLVRDTPLHQDIASLLGALRANISLYNAALEQGANSVILEEGLQRIYNLLDPIDTERFTNYANAQNLLRKYEKETGKKILNENGIVSHAS